MPFWPYGRLYPPSHSCARWGTRVSKAVCKLVVLANSCCSRVAVPAIPQLYSPGQPVVLTGQSAMAL